MGATLHRLREKGGKGGGVTHSRTQDWGGNYKNRGAGPTKGQKRENGDGGNQVGASWGK